MLRLSHNNCMDMRKQENKMHQVSRTGEMFCVELRRGQQKKRREEIEEMLIWGKMDDVTWGDELRNEDILKGKEH